MLQIWEKYKQGNNRDTNYFRVRKFLHNFHKTHHTFTRGLETKDHLTMLEICMQLWFCVFIKKVNLHKQNKRPALKMKWSEIFSIEWTILKWST